MKGLSADNGGSAFLNKWLTGETEADWGWVREVTPLWLQWRPGWLVGGAMAVGSAFSDREKKGNLEIYENNV